MSTPDADLAALRAGLAEDEAIARAADATRWLPQDKGVTFEHNDTRSDYEGRVTADTKANMIHIAHFGPRRVLRQAEAIREKVIQPYLAAVDALNRLSDNQLGYEERARVYAFDAVIEALAGIYTEPTEEKS
jgi:hypothetical protein